MPSQSYQSFLTQLDAVDQLIAIHERLQTGKGRRHQQDALHQAGVVMTVAAWQAYIEKFVREALDVIEVDIADPTAVPPAPNWARHSFSLRRAAIEIQLKKFNTPNTVNVRDLLDGSFGFKPWPCWEWRQGPRQWDENKTRKRTEDWVAVRHTIAHGYPLPNDKVFLQDANGNARLTKGLLEECLKHFKHVALKTDEGLREYLVNRYGIIAPW